MYEHIGILRISPYLAEENAIISRVSNNLTTRKIDKIL